MVQNDVLGTSKLEGLIQEREEGFVQGRAEGKAEVARNLKQMGFPLDNIMRATGLTEEEITRPINKVLPIFIHLLCTKSRVTTEGHRTYFGGRAQDCWSHGAQVSRSQDYETAYGIKSLVGISVYQRG